jgi:hypothetical protein
VRLSWSGRASAASPRAHGQLPRVCHVLDEPGQRPRGDRSGSVPRIGTGGPKNSKTPIAMPSRRGRNRGGRPASRPPARPAPTASGSAVWQIGDGPAHAARRRTPADEPGAGRERARSANPASCRHAHRPHPAHWIQPRRRAQAARSGSGSQVDRRMATGSIGAPRRRAGPEVLPGRRDPARPPARGRRAWRRACWPGRHVPCPPRARPIDVPVACGGGRETSTCHARPRGLMTRTRERPRGARRGRRRAAVGIGDFASRSGAARPRIRSSPQRAARSVSPWAPTKRIPRSKASTAKPGGSPGQQGVGHDRTVDHRPGVAIGRRFVSASPNTSICEA